MKIIIHKEEAENWVNSQKNIGKSIGFVPTMGALHRGHLSLVEESKAQADLTAVSIYVNPTQFNNSKDLETYPRNTERDLALLREAQVDMVFLPSTEEMYEQNEGLLNVDFGTLATVMEGSQRPGHFQGVATIVQKLFSCIPADKAFFGEKDFQQLMIIKSLVQQLNIEIEIVGCSIIREENGLAMSSRNERLTKDQRERAAIIFQSLQYASERAKLDAWKSIQKEVIQSINAQKDMEVEYFEIAEITTLQSLSAFDYSVPTQAFIVVNVGGVRLIDNVKLF